MSRQTAALALVFTLAAPAAFAADLALEINAAQMHARLSSRNIGGANDKVENVHIHMQHAINCLVGPKGEGFDPAQTNPCAATGNGVIPDTADPARKAKFQAVVELLKTGLAATDVLPAKEIGLKAADTIAAMGQN